MGMIDGRKQYIGLGDEVKHRATGRIGRTTQVTLTQVWVRFVENEKARQIDRRDVDSVKFLTAQAECIEDDANALAYRKSR